MTKDDEAGEAVGADESTWEQALRRQGAIAWLNQSLHRQAVHELRGNFHAISLNLVLLRRAANGELDGVANVQEKQQGWVQAIEDEMAKANQSFDLWTKLLVDEDEEDGPWDLRRLLGDLDGLLTPLAQRLGIEFEVQHPEEAVEIEGSRTVLTRLLTSLAAASIQAEGERFLLCLEVVDGEACLEASPGDDEPQAGDEDIDDRRQQVMAIIDSSFTDLGGRFEFAGQDRWTMKLPLAEAEKEWAES